MSTPWEIVKRPFTFAEIEVKCQTASTSNVQESNGKKYGKALATPYYDARAVMERLDEAFGPAGWSATYREVHVAGGKVAFICHLEVEVGDKKVIREDGADCSDIEPTKGGISGSLKRAFSALGNRTLYAVELGWYECELYEKQGKLVFSKWTSQALQKMQADYERQITAQKGVATLIVEDGGQVARNGGAKSNGETIEVQMGKWLRKDLQLTKQTFEMFVDKCKAMNRGWVATAAKAHEEAVTTCEELFTFISGLKEVPVEH